MSLLAGYQQHLLFPEEYIDNYRLVTGGPESVSSSFFAMKVSFCAMVSLPSLSLRSSFFCTMSKGHNLSKNREMHTFVS